MAVQPHAPITQLLTQYITSQVQGPTGVKTPAAARTANACPACGYTHAQFRQSGLLGCPECYAAFEGQLGPLLARAHEGGTQHVGKSPSRLRPDAARGASSKETLETRRSRIQNRITEAVAAEKYELAANLRDELRRLEGMVGQPAKRTGATRRAGKAGRPAEGGDAGAGGTREAP